METGQVSADHDWVRVDLQKSFTDPVLVVKPLSHDGSDPAVVRIRNLDSSGFEIRVQEWDYLDGTHVQERVSYLVMERGTYTLTDGTRIEADRFETDQTGSFGPVTFIETFNYVPIVMAAITTFNETDAVTGRLQNISTRGFDFSMQEQERNSQTHLNETVDYIAWEPSTGIINDITFEVGKTGNVVTDDFHAILFNQNFLDSPLFLADMQTADGGDTANVRWQNKSAGSVEVQIDEEQSSDSETAHTTEVVGYMAFEQ